MDEVCEYLSEIPPADISAFFKPGAAFLQKRLALRYSWCALYNVYACMLFAQMACLSYSPSLVNIVCVCVHVYVYVYACVYPSEGGLYLPLQCKKYYHLSSTLMVSQID